MYKINPISLGDAVFHPGTGQKGLVVEVRGQLVKFELIGVASPDGKQQYATYSCKKLKIVARWAEVLAGALALKQEADKKKTWRYRIAQAFRSLRATRK